MTQSCDTSVTGVSLSLQMKALPHEFSHRVTGAVPGGFLAAAVQCWSSQFSL